MKKLLVTASAVVLGIACLSGVSVKTYADCEEVIEVPRGPGGSAYVFIPLPGYSAPSVGTMDLQVVKKGRVIGNNEFGFGVNEEERDTSSEDTSSEDVAVIDPITLPAE